MTRPGVHRLRLAIRPGEDDEPRSLVVGRYQPLADGSGCLCFPLPDQTCLLQSLQKTKKRIGKPSQPMIFFGFYVVIVTETNDLKPSPYKAEKGRRS